MKRFICLFIALAMIPMAALADRVALSEHYALFISGGAGTAGKGALFDFDSLSADLYLMEDGQTGYLCTTKCFAGVFITTGMIKITISDQAGTLYFVDDNGGFVTAVYDENGEDLWISLEGHQFRMSKVRDLAYFDDVKE